jgi:hypothetical protein
MADDIEIVAKLKLDTSEAEGKISSMAKTGASKAVDLSLPKDTEIKLPETTKKSLSGLFEGPGGLENVTKLAQGAQGGVKGLLGSMKGLTVGATAATAAMAAVAAIFVLIMKLLEGTDTMKAIQASLEMLMNSLRETLAPILALVGEIVIVLADALKALMPILDPIVAVVASALNSIVGVLKVLLPVIELLGKLQEVFSAISSIFTDVLMGAMTSVFNILIELVDTALKPVIAWLNKLIEFIEGIKLAVQNFITDLTGGIITFNKTTLASTEAIKADLKSSLDTWETSGSENASERQAELAAEASMSAAEAASMFKAKIDEFLTALVSVLSKAWESIRSFFGDAWNSFKDNAANVWNNVKDWAVGVWDSIGEVATNVWSAIKDVAGGVWSWIQDIAGGVWKNVANAALQVWDAIKNWFRNLFGGEGSSGIVAGIGEGIGNVVGTVSGWVSDAASAVGGWFKNVFNFDSGGTLPRTGSQVWGMNEKGNPEFLFNGGGHDTVINSEILADAMYKAMMKANSNQPKTLEVSIKDGIAAGPRELAQMLLPSLKFLLK